MKNSLRAGALALALFACATARADNLTGLNIKAPGGFLPGVALYCDDGTGKAVVCSLGGGGGGTSDASAANQATQIAAEQAIRDRIGATSAPTTGSTNALLTSINTLMAALAAAAADPTASAVTIDHTAPGTSDRIIATADHTTPGVTDKFLVAPQGSATSASTSATAATASALLLAANPARLGCSIVNDATSIMYLKLSAGASSTSWDKVIDAKTTVGGEFECPYGWQGPIYAAWATAGTGTAHISERAQ